MATQKNAVRMRENGEFLLISVDLESYHYRLSTDKLGCVAYASVGASHHALGPNIHAIEMESLKNSRFVMLSVGPADDPTREEHSVFLDLMGKAACNPVSGSTTNYAEFVRGPTMASGCFSVYARPREDGQSVIIPRHSAGSTDLEKYALPGRPVNMLVPSNDQSMENLIQNMYDTGDDIVLVFRDNIMHLFGSDEQVVNMTMSFVGNVTEVIPKPRTIRGLLAQYDASDVLGPYPDTHDPETGLPRMYMDHSELMRQKMM
jgi:hypothetical protein